MAGVENEKDFYKLFPTEEAFFGMYPEAKKLVQKAYGGLIKAQDGVEYKGPSVVDYLATKGYQGSKQFRKALAQEYGVENYDYSAAKNLELLNKLRENQELLSKHEQSFTPVSVESIEQLHQKNKAGLDRHSSLPGKKEAKKDFDERKFSTLLDIAKMSAPSSLSAPIPSLRLSSGKGASGGGRRQQPKPSDPIQEGEYDVQEKPQLQVQKQESPGFTDYLNLAANVIMPGMFNPFNTAKNIYDAGSEAVQDVKDFGTQAINYAKRQYDLYTGAGDDLNKTKSEIKIPSPSTAKKEATKTSKLAIDGVPYVEGTPIDMDDKGSRYYTKPTWIDLNSPSLKLGARNRGSRLGNIKSEGFVITPFAKEYGTEYNDDDGLNTIRKYKDNEIVNDKIYGGVDNNGNFYLDYGKNLKGKNLQMADFRSLDVTGIAKNKSGRYIYGDATDNKRVARTAKAFDTEGKPTIDLNLLVPKKKIKTGHESFGVVGGGRYILATPDLSKKVLVAGSLKNIDQYIEDFKKNTGSKVIKLIPLDNGTFARGLSTKDGIITDEDQANYDNFNNKGGAAFYLLNKKHGGPVLPKAQVGINGGFQPINFQQQPLTLNPGASTLNNGFSQFSLSQGMPQLSFNAAQDMGIPDCGEGATWDPIKQMCVPKKGFTQLNNPITGQSSFIKEQFEYQPQSEPIKQLWGQTTETTTVKPKSSFAEKLGSVVNTVRAGLALGSFAASEFDYRRALKDQKKSLRNKLFTQSAMPQLSGFRGDYVTNTGAFRPDYTVNKGMFVSNMPGARMAKFGGQMLQFGGGAIEEAIVPTVPEFSPIVTPQVDMAEKSIETANEPKKYKYSGANPIAEKTWDEISKQYAGVKFLGVWGDESHKKRKSDHNTGNALDIGILNIEQGDKIAEQLISEADDKRIKYLIFNNKIWSPEKGWKKYNKDNPHTNHVHVSFYPYEGVKTKAGESLAVAHNNPGNIHFGEFTSQWGAEKGAYDNKGHVAKFKSLDDGWDAFNKLIKGNAYSNLSLPDARKKWVTGDKNKDTPSAALIVKEMGLDPNTKVRDLTPEQLTKYSSLFVKYEDNKMYKKMKKMKYFERGGEVPYTEGEEYDLTEDEIRQILENGGDIEFI